VTLLATCASLVDPARARGARGARLITRRAAPVARCALGIALALLAVIEPTRAQEPPAGARASDGGSASGERAARPRPTRFASEVPSGFESWARGLAPAERRVLRRRLVRLPEAQRRDFFARWERMTPAERDALAGKLRVGRERSAELPPRLRTPEMRERLREMSPEERERFFARAREWRNLDRAERTRMRGRLAAFGTLDEAEQRALVDGKFAGKSEAERAQILAQLRQASAHLERRKAQAASGGSASGPPAVDAVPESSVESDATP
jgi:hypothetical protein